MRLAVALRPSLVDASLAKEALSPQAWALFVRMSPGDRAHALCVLARLQAKAAVEPWLAEAALLHDGGKIESGLSLPYRIAIVLLGARFARWARDDPSSWRYPFHLHAQHAKRGAELCAQAGCDPRAIDLVRWHDSPPCELPDANLQDALAALQAADNQC